MSLHFIGIRDFPFLHRQLTSPPVGMVKSPVSVGDLAQDSKDVLVQRLNDLALQLTREENLRDEVVTELHNEVDRMEKAIHSSVWSPQNLDSITGKIPSSDGSLRSPGNDIFRSPFSPNQNVKMRLPETPLTTSHSNLQEALEMSPKKIVLIANEAEFLNQKLRDTLQALQARKEETDHIHDLLITRAEKAAQRIIQLESQVKNLDAHFETSQSELTFLRIQLQALEVQGLQYIPVNVDEELVESIKNWKRDWADLDQRTKAKGRRCKEVLEDLDWSHTTVDTS